MTQRSERFPPLDPDSLKATRDALHSYARVLGAWAAACRKKRKHWWHASLRPTVQGLTTGVIYGDTDVELELSFVTSEVQVRTASRTVSTALAGQSSAALAKTLCTVLKPMGLGGEQDPAEEKSDDAEHEGYSPEQARLLHRAIASVTPAMERLRAGIREETSPIQHWPHYFDLSMIWLPGDQIPGKDPEDEEQADKQMNFGFTFGDDGIPEPYFYVTAYPQPDEMPGTDLPEKTTWHSDGFNGAVALYKDVVATNDPEGYLLDLWQRLLAVGKRHLAEDN